MVCLANENTMKILKIIAYIMAFIISCALYPIYSTKWALHKFLLNDNINDLFND